MAMLLCVNVKHIYIVGSGPADVKGDPSSGLRAE